jgi:uncharacterized RDD family membrane protein YckC
MVAGLFFFDFFASLGGWGRLVGFSVALAYFTLFNSAWGKGKTVGKRIMGIEVVDSTGGHISVSRSFLRYLVLGVPFFLNGAPFPPAVIASPVGYLVGFLIFGLGGSIVYLYVFNRKTRQSLHDLMVGTFVVRGKGSGQFAAGTIWWPHLVIMGFLCLAVIGLSFASISLLKKGVFSDILLVQEKLLASGKVHGAMVYVGKARFDHDGVRQEASFLQSTVVWKVRPTNYQAAADEMASIILANYPDIAKKDSLVVIISYGYDIGISHVWITQSFQHSPQQWISVLGGTK